MARILTHSSHKETWFERLSTVSYYTEGEFEQRILQHSAELFKDYYVLPFKLLISHVLDENKTTKPDLLLIKHDYSEWWLVEVEKSEHGYAHVEQQVSVMKNAKINPVEVANYIKSKEAFVLEPPNFKFDNAKLDYLIKRIKPKVMVVVDYSVDWIPSLKKLDVKLCIIQVYRNPSGQEIYRIKGQYPYIFMDAGYCRTAKAPYNANTLEVINPDILSGYSSGDEIDIVYEDSLTKWNLLRTTKKVYLKSMGKRFPLKTSYDYTLRIDVNNKFYFEN